MDINVDWHQWSTNFLTRRLEIFIRKLNKIWVNQCSKFYKRSIKSRLYGNGIEVYSTYSLGKSVVSERFIKTLKTKIYKHMTAVSDYVYIDELNEIVDIYN